MKKRLKIAGVLWVMVMTLLAPGCGSDDTANPSTQVTNNSGSSLAMVKMENVEFTQYLDNGGCLGCSTGFKDVPEGGNAITLQVTGSPDWITLGTLGPFESDSHYSVNISDSGGLCAELWLRHQTSSTFNDDTTRELITTSCAASTQVTNNSGTSLAMVKVDNVEFTQYLDNGGCFGCSTGFKDVPEGGNTITLNVTGSPNWITLGTLGPFESDTTYSVNITYSGGFCAELWLRHQTSSTFNDDTTRELITTSCP